jgi:ClpP class serine protease
MSYLKSTKGGKNVNIEAFLASLLNEPWLVEEAWLETVISLLQKKDASALSLKNSHNSGTDFQIFNGKAVIPIHGPIFSTPNFLTEILGIGCVTSEITKDLEAMLAESDVDSIILDFDSPGGTVTGTNQLSTLISKGTEEKDITAYIGGTGASAAYWLASGATSIVLDATARVGSIGVVSAYPLPEKDGYSVELVNTASPNKRPDVSTEKGKKVVVEMLDDLADVFINTVATNRGVSASTVEKDFGKGGMLVGQKAVDAGMADSIGSLKELLGEQVADETSISNLNINDEGDDSTMKPLTIESLQADHKEVYASIMASVTTSLEANFAKSIAAKDEEVASLKEKLEVASDESTTLETRIKDLEKKDTLRSEKDTKATANVIFSEKLSACSIPDRLHSKIRSQVDYNKFMSEGKLDHKAFGDAIVSEITDWEETLASDDFVQGLSTVARSNGDNPTDDDATADRMASYL